MLPEELRKKFQSIFEDSETGLKRPTTENGESNQGTRSAKNQETMKATATAVTLALDPMGNKVRTEIGEFKNARYDLILVNLSKTHIKIDTIVDIIDFGIMKIFSADPATQ